MENQTEEPKKKFYTRWWFWALVVIFIIIIANAGNQGSTPSPTSAPTPTQSASVPKSPLTSFGDGTYIVGTDIQSGTYRNSGGSNCYYARLSGFGGTSADIIDNENTDTSAIVTISSTDKGFQSKNCGTWTQIQLPATKAKKTIPTQQPATTQPTPTPTPVASISCSTDNQCGTNALTGSPSCQNNAVYQNYITYICNKAGTLQSYCSNSKTQQLQQTCNSSQTCSNGTCNTLATWHTAFSYSDTSGNNTTSFSLRGNQSRITYSCTTSDSSLNAGWFNGIIEATDPSQPYPQSDNFATTVDCPINKTFNEYSLPSGQYYLHLDSWNSSYTVTIEDYY